MSNKISGTFEVKMNPEAVSFEHLTTLIAGRLNLDKTFHGSLSGKSKGEMISILNSQKTAGGYVAVEIFTGTLVGKEGSFGLQHFGKTSASGQSLVLEVVPGSGEGQLDGINGTMSIRIEEGQHHYDFEYEL